MRKLEKRNIRDILTLTPMQKGMLFHYLENPNNDMYWEQLSLILSGEIDSEIFEKAWNFVVKTNEMLRTVFRWEQVENPIQIVLEEHKLQPWYYDFSRNAANEKKNKTKELQANNKKQKLDLKDVPFRVSLCKLEKTKYVMMISHHHILYDGWSTGIILKEFFDIYHDLFQGKSPGKQLKTRFKEFVKWLYEQDIDEEKRFWQKYLQGFDTLAGPPIKQETRDDTDDGKYRLYFETGTTEKLNVFVKQHKITLAAFLYTTWGILLQKYNNSDDVIFGTTVSGRSIPVKGIEDMVGLFINTLPLRVQARERENIGSLLNRIDDTLRTRRPYEHTSLVNIKKCSEIDNKQELFDCIVVMENYPLEPPRRQNAGMLSVQSYTMEERSHYDLTISVILHEGENIEVDFSYKGCFNRETVTRLADHFSHIVLDIMAEPGKEVFAVEMLGKEEKRRLLKDFNQTSTNYPNNKTIHELFSQQVERTPDRIALIGNQEKVSLGRFVNAVGENVSITYRELNQRCGQLAGLLIEKGVQTDTIVGIMLERSPEMIIGILAILKAGGAYMPIDPVYPQERINYMLTDSGVSILVTSPVLSERFEKLLIVNCQLLMVNEMPSYRRRLNNPPKETNYNLQLERASLAYIIYTSGSSGRPKGVMVEHGNVARLVRNPNFILSAPGDRLLLTGAFVFDITTFEIWYPLLNGLTLFLIDQATILDVEKLGEFMVKNKISILHLIPQLFNQLAQQCLEIFAGLRYFLVGGDLVRPRSVNRLRSTYKQIKILHMYGPTENTTFSTFFPVDKDYPATIPIGKPLGNSSVYILDKHGYLQPIEVPGELCAGGKGVARGYLNNPELTLERFINYNRSYIPEKLYRTGDLARWLPDGNIEFLGRLDSQVKIRGFRIELGEIENRLIGHREIKEAVVVDRIDSRGNKFLCAYIVPVGVTRGGPTGIRTDIDKVKEYLSQSLPGYMVPAHFMLMDQIPLTFTGKINRGALPKPEFNGKAEEYISPADEPEEKLVLLWSEILGVTRDKISINSDFFELGGHSLSAILLAAKINKAFNVKIPLAEIFSRSVLVEMSRYIKKAAPGKYIPLEPGEKKEYYPLSSSQKRLYILQQMEPDNMVYNMSTVINIEGNPHPGRLEETFMKLIRRHESFKTSFHLLENEPVQRIHDEVHFEIEYYNLTRKQVEVRISEFIGPFDLSQSPLLHVSLIDIGKEESILMVDMHHIISDAISTVVLINEFAALYEGETLPDTRIRYKDFSEWQNSKKEKDTVKKQEVFWLKQFEGEIPILILPYDYERPAILSFDGHTLHFIMGKEETGALRKIAHRQGMTMFIVLLAIYNIFLAKISDREDIVVGTSSAGRNHPDLEQTMGIFVNTLVFRNYPREEKAFGEFLQEVKENTLQAFENQDYPFDELVERVSKDREANRNPLFDVRFKMDNFELSTFEVAGLKLAPYTYENKTSKFDMTLTVLETNDTLDFEFEYCSKLFREETMERFFNYIKQIAVAVIKNHDIKIEDIEVSHDLLSVNPDIGQVDLEF